MPTPALETFRGMFRRNAGENGEPGQEDQGVQLPQPEFYSTMIPLPDKDFIMPLIESEEEFAFDVFDLERRESTEVGHLILDAQSRLYVAEYMVQKERQIVFPEHEQYVSPYKNYREMPKADFKNLMTELSSELMFKLETGEDTNRVFADLKQLTSGSYLLREVVSLYNVSTTQDPNRIKLMELYFRKIFSLVDEDYLEAKRITEEIEQLNA